MQVKFQPLRDGLLVKRLEAESKTSGGIIIPDTAKEKPIQGEVVSVGEGAYDTNGNLMKMHVKAGDRILFGKWAGTDIKLNNEDYIVMKEADVLGIIKN